MEAVDEVPWARLGYWPDGPDAVPELLREIAAAPSGMREGSPVGRLWNGLFHDIACQEVYAAAPYLVPYLMESVRVARQPHRGLIVDLMTAMAKAQPHRNVFRDPAAGPEPDHAALARNAMVEHVDTLVRLLNDVSPNVVAKVARLLACLPKAMPQSVPALRARAEKAARRPGDTGAAACVLAVAWLAAADHAAWFNSLLSDPSVHRDLRATAAAGLALSDPTAEPDDDALIKLMADVHADAGSVLERFVWHGLGITPLNTALIGAEHWQREVTRDLLLRPGHQAVDRGLHSAREAIWHWRAAPAELLPLLADLARDLVSVSRPKNSQQDALRYAVQLIAGSGQAAAAYADVLAAMLTGEPAEPWPEAVAPAVEGLAMLGDGRCIPWLIAAFQDQHGHVKHLNVRDMIPALVVQADALIPALKHYLGPSDTNGTMQYVDCCDALISWGAAAAPLAPAITARLAPMYLSVVLPLFGAMGPAAADVEPQIRALLDDERDQHEAAWALWRITGDPGQAPALLTEHLERYGGHAARDVAPMLEQFGPAATIAAPVLRRHFYDAEHGHLYDRVAIARALFAITGDSEGLVTPLLEAITARPLSDLGHRWVPSELLAVEALGRIGSAAEAAVPALETIAYGRARVTDCDVWADEHYQQTARSALASINQSNP
ncbi:hypothetical protein ACFFV7_32435 [Nonomuraea spiralis]|uniref:HEAT repeat domain-containing protein n=1 Tax=Nonomuraea spiralis TaxID=46182 RepID=A0ABV5IN13_9ACTN|nr:hypothetical protein [Nonomuraea spiralis]GGT38277.1 hypothetical protein GCM10010176_097910 [Nonomuraea spiralis]